MGWTPAKRARGSRAPYARIFAHFPPYACTFTRSTAAAARYLTPGALAYRAPAPLPYSGLHFLPHLNVYAFCFASILRARRASSWRLIAAAASAAGLNAATRCFHAGADNSGWAWSSCIWRWNKRANGMVTYVVWHFRHEGRSVGVNVLARRLLSISGGMA